MKYSELPIGVEIYTVREAFAADAASALRRIREIGYDGVEFWDPNYELDPVFLKEALQKNGLACYGILSNWKRFQPEELEKTVQWNQALGNRYLAIGSLSAEQTKDKASLYDCIAFMNALLEKVKPLGFTMGYHNHASDFREIEGKTIWDHVFENTPADFQMVLDTGNAVAGGGDPIGSLKKYPGRQEWMHIKPYSATKFWETGYDAMIGEDDFDWQQLIRTCVETGGCRVLTVEYGNRGRFQPFYGAHLCIKHLKEILNAMDRKGENKNV